MRGVWLFVAVAWGVAAALFGIALCSAAAEEVDRVLIDL